MTNITGVRIKIFDREKCLYEREAPQSNKNDLKTLFRDLRETQSEVNKFLTTLIQQRDESASAQNKIDQSISSDVESESSEEEKEAKKEEEEEEAEARVNPKKCKLSI